MFCFGWSNQAHWFHMICFSALKTHDSISPFFREELLATKAAAWQINVAFWGEIGEGPLGSGNSLMKQPYMARVNVLEKQGARSPILVTNDGIPQITGDVPVSRTKGPQFGYLPQNDSFIVRSTSAWRARVRVREKKLTCQETSGHLV